MKIRMEIALHDEMEKDFFMANVSGKLKHYARLTNEFNEKKSQLEKLYNIFIF